MEPSEMAAPPLRKQGSPHRRLRRFYSRSKTDWLFGGRSSYWLFDYDLLNNFLFWLCNLLSLCLLVGDMSGRDSTQLLRCMSK